MLLIGDGGSTKIDWALFDARSHCRHFQTEGFNPSYNEAATFTERLLELDIEHGLLRSVYYYGAGCSSPARCGIVEEGIKRLVPESAHIEIAHDLLGAARACCGTESGIACILGTGSNSCSFDGSEIIDNIENLGYLLGDEGSGCHIGKQLVRAYIYREMPETLAYAFEADYSLGKNALLDRIYGPGAKPNVYLASMSRFAKQHETHPFIKDMLLGVFDVFLQRHVVKYEGHASLPINFVGSVAFVFEELLRKSLASNGLRFGRVVRSPIHALENYHLKKK
jgi:glucosamine kinase